MASKERKQKKGMNVQCLNTAGTAIISWEDCCFLNFQDTAIIIIRQAENINCLDIMKRHLKCQLDTRE